jgi:LacI family transcriptional regulator
LGVLPSDPVAKSLRKLGCPLVRIGYLPHPQDHLVPAVLPDLGKAGDMAADHFLSAGFTHIAQIGSDPWSLFKPLQERFKSRCLQHAISPEVFRVKAGIHAESFAAINKRFASRSKSLIDWLQSLPKPLGVLVGGDWRAARVCMICSAAGMFVPESVAILGVGNEEIICEMSPTSLSSLDISRKKCSYEAVHLLRRLMKGHAAPVEPLYVAPQGVVLRRSTDVLPVKNQNVVRSLRFIWDHYQEDISVHDVARVVGVSRRTLERAFKEHMQGSVNSEIQNKRLGKCCELLERTNMKIQDLVPLCGFHSADYLHQVFRKKFGTTPRLWRIKHAASSFKKHA